MTQDARPRGLLLLVLLLGVVLTACPPPGLRLADFALLPPPPQVAGARRLVVLSDMHMGPGHVGPDPAAAQAPWDPYEDFRWADAFLPFLERIDAEGQGRTDLVLNGDTFELWQSRLDNCRSRDPNAGCTAPEALQRLAVVLRAHQRELSALGAFARSGDNRVILVPGNHDDALLFPQVAAAVVAATGAPRRVRVASAGYFRSRDGLIYVEHGHQTDNDGNYIRGWPEPFLPSARGPVLRRSWGEQFVQLIFDPLENKYPLSDNVYPYSQALRFGMAAEGRRGSIDVVLHLIDFTLHQTSYGQIRELWGARRDLWEPEDTVPVWDVDAVRRQGARFLGVRLKHVSDAIIAGLCDRRQVTRQEELAQGQTPTAALCPLLHVEPVTGQVKQVAPRAATRKHPTVLQSYLRALRTALQHKTGIATQQPFLLYIFSHTHQAVAPAPVLVDDWQPLAVNTGAWQRVCSGPWLEETRVERGLAKGAALRDLDLSALPDCYNFVVVEPYASGPPRPHLRAFQRRGGGYVMREGTCLVRGRAPGK